jgi:hypothetical protein
MNIDSVSSSVASASMAIAVKQLQAISEAQMEVMKNLAESQAQMAQMLQAEGIGLNVDISV